MVKKTINYTDYNGVNRSEDFYFNLTKAELLEMETSMSGGLSKMIEEIIKTQDTVRIIEIFKKLIIQSYGEKSPDGKRFMKNDEIRASFVETEAYSNLFMELSTNSEAATAFFNGIVPAVNA